MVNTLIVRFDGESSAVYNPNQTVRVTVEMKLDKTVKKAKGLRLTISGTCHAKWTEGGGRSSVTYQGEQVIINAFVYFFGSKDNQEPIEVPQGTHFYNHSIRIPHGAPSSAEGKHGYIRYKASVNLDIPFMPDLTSEASFVVMRLENLNFYPELKLANEVEEVKTFCCFLCETEPIMVKLSLAKTGFVPGDKILVQVEIFNKSNVSFPKSTISLNRVETYLSYTPLNKTKTFIAPVIEVKSKGTNPKKNRNFEEIVQIPEEVEVSNERFSDVFQVSYEISFYMKQANKSSSIQASIPIFIGTTGFRPVSRYSLESNCEDMEEMPPFCKKDENMKVSQALPENFDFIL